MRVFLVRYGGDKELAVRELLSSEVPLGLPPLDPKYMLVMATMPREGEMVTYVVMRDAKPLPPTVKSMDKK